MPPDAAPPDAEELLLRAVADACDVPPPRDVAEWAEAERIVPAESGSPWPGRWNTARVPYLREIMQVMSLSHPARRVTFVKAAQLGGSEAALNLIGQIMAETPTSVLTMLPSIDMVRGYNRLKLDPMIAATPRLRERVRDQVERDDEASTVTFKRFPGGYLQLLTAASSANLQMRSARVLICEEVSDYPIDTGGRGDPVAQLEARSIAYAGREKIIKVSTPAEEGSCRVTEEYERSSKGRYLVPCPHCGERQALEWESLRWPKGRPLDAEYHCVACGAGIAHAHKPAMLAAGAWVHERPEMVDLHAGYSLSGLYSPTLSWADLAEEWERVHGDQEKTKTFVQQKLGRAWRVAGEAPEWQRLYDRREEWLPGTVPAGALVLTAGVDVQRDRLEASIWGWGRARESWLVDHVVISGSPFLWRTWEQMATLLNASYPHEAGGAVPIALSAVDSSDGVSTAEVYAFVRRVGVRRAVAVKGRDGLPQAIAPGGKVDVKRNGQRIGRLKPFLVGSSYLKGELYGHLRLDRPTAESGEPFPPGYVHLPVHVAGEEFCRQLVAEELRRGKARNGTLRLEWVKTRERNEALDCRVYARAAAVLLGVDRWSDARWQELAAAVAMAAPRAPVLQHALALGEPDAEMEDADDAPDHAPAPPVAMVPPPVKSDTVSHPPAAAPRPPPAVRPRSWSAGFGAAW
jgi:phage terminase large subunit GpA-like protein